MENVIDKRLPNIIDHNMTLYASHIYGIDKKVIVTPGVTLKIEPGTTIAGCSLFSFLAILQNAKIDAKGTKDKPITFTSQIDLLGFSSDEGVGEWGGVIIAGNAYTHYKNNRYEADESIAFGNTTHKYDHESSGALEYVIIKHSGYEVKKDKELNGLSLAGVGSGTVLKNIAILGGKDDGIEIWGGTATINGLFVYNAMDDSVDVDLGYRGKITNVLVVQNKVANTNNHDSSAMELGNDENLIITNTQTATLPTISNFTGYIKGGGIYNKYDAGFELSNVKLISKKSQHNEMLFFRGKDSYTSGAKYFQGNVCFYNPTKGYDLNTYLAHTNAKKPKNNYTPYKYFIINHKAQGAGKLLISTKCSGANRHKIWLGEASMSKKISFK